MWVKLLLILLSILSLPTIIFIFCCFLWRGKECGCITCKNFYSVNAFNWGMCKKLNDTTLPGDFWCRYYEEIEK